MRLNATHNPKHRSWVESANVEGCEFPIQNLPFGIFRRKGANEAPRGGVAIGDAIVDLAAFAKSARLRGAAREAARACAGPTLNALLELGPAHWSALRQALSRALSAGEAGWEARKAKLSAHLVPMAEAELLLPIAIGDYTDFYTSVFHATNIGRMFRPDSPLMPNYKWVPIGYHGRASSVVVSGTPVVRPEGQTRAPDAAAPSFSPCKRLDYEVELGFVVGPGNRLGETIPLASARDHVFGVVLLNDWSARDIQAWEYQPLGPFLAKSFATTVSPWIVTMEALEPYRVPAFARPEGDPAPLPHLFDRADQAEGGYAIEVEMWLRSAKMRAAGTAPHRLSLGNYASCYWTLAQTVAHHASNGCNLRAGDLLGSGTISGPEPGSQGALIEITEGGRNPVSLPSGETRTFIEDGDEIIQRGRCVRDGYATIGFGEAAGLVRPAKGSDPVIVK
ncbi:MAG: fumarylacetoacetase [Burkholderiales bacterium]|nr:fumarylacetoacetase [Burkholderiales bacterium]